MDRTAPKLVTIFGGSGFVGTHLVQLLARQGYRIRVAVRRPDLAGETRMFGAVGQVVPIQANLRNEASVQRAVAGADIVVNLVGVGHESGKQRFAAVHVEGATLIARAAKATGAGALVHMSALGVDKAAGVSAYAASKLAGEAAVLEAFPQAVILRPSIMFGMGDGFFNLMGTLARLFPILPLISGKTLFQPVFVGDVAEALAKAAEGAVKTGRIYELGGPDVESHEALMRRILREAGRKRLLLPMPAGLAKFGAALLGILPFKPLITGDQVNLLGVDNVVSEAARKDKRTFAAFGIEPTSMDQVLPTYMWRFRRNGEFDRQDQADPNGSVTA
ncbi:complex I NDUFA9 subunit family protein [Devosia sp. YIM 151766]|uniref:complex I NDUFA9 subunit family protein n=1 Tax=Devosia sp. YIM 151766 TaxID=3017325 RepID=UPI00255D006E|nr:complex I NDUFA9 subunit family protein [Devosia sp. YIM 151766]WIY52990.1 complex I NDUFA9 subunit family protein [Devosia sp. YIM 151766]